MYEIEQKKIGMTLEEFKKYDVPEGWRMTMISGEEKRGRPGSMDRYFVVRVYLEKE